jgi:2-hydroxychromene-2-carboxylate isomerase
MAQDHIDFWFTMGSTYSYLSVMRLETLAAKSGIKFCWRPFHLLVILQEMKHVPFADKPAKMAYMWRDLGRRATMHGIEASLPAPYPAKQSVMANLVALIGMQQGWGEDFIRCLSPLDATGAGDGSEPNLSGSLGDMGQEPEPVLALANAPETMAALMEETRAASELGIFGSPTFAIGRELFWGDDRLEDVVSWYRHGCVRTTG